MKKCNAYIFRLQLPPAAPVLPYFNYTVIFFQFKPIIKAFLPNWKVKNIILLHTLQTRVLDGKKYDWPRLIS